MVDHTTMFMGKLEAEGHVFLPYAARRDLQREVQEGGQNDGPLHFTVGAARTMWSRAHFMGAITALELFCAYDAKSLSH